MGLFSIGGALNKSVFGKESYAGAIGDDKTNGYAVVKISPKYARTGETVHDPDIKGVYNFAEGDLSFNIDSTWADMGGIASSVLGGAGGAIIDAYQKGSNIANIFGATANANVYASKKIYQKSNYMTIKIPMMVVDWKGNGQSVVSALLLAWYCLPSGNITDKINKASKDYINNQLEAMRSAGATEEMIANFLQGTENFTEGVVTKGTKWLKENAQKGIDFAGMENAKDNIVGDLEEIATLRASPVPVKVQIGNFFQHNDMVIENLEYTFSKEMTKAGPLYVKFNINLSTRTILSQIEDIGLKVTQNSRFKEFGGNLTGF